MIIKNKKLKSNIQPPNMEQPSWSWKNPLSTLSGATLLVIFTRLLCPSCWPMYVGILSSMGLSFLIQKAWLMPLTMITLMFVMISLAYRANSRRGFKPFTLGMLGAMALFGGQFIFPSISIEKDLLNWVLISKWSMDVGAILLITASIWNGWPMKRDSMKANKCSSCMPKTTEA